MSENKETMDALSFRIPWLFSNKLSDRTSRWAIRLSCKYWSACKTYSKKTSSHRKCLKAKIHSRPMQTSQSCDRAIWVRPLLIPQYLPNSSPWAPSEPKEYLPSNQHRVRPAQVYSHAIALSLISTLSPSQLISGLPVSVHLERAA